jgi:hypothetical protein
MWSKARSWSKDLKDISLGSPRDVKRPEGSRSDPAALSGLVLSETADASGELACCHAGNAGLMRLVTFPSGTVGLSAIDGEETRIPPRGFR